MEMSLAMTSTAVADFVVSVWLVAVTLTVAGEGRSAGAVYKPAAEMVPVDVLPLGMPFTLHVTSESVVFVTVAANACEFPSKTDPLAGVTVTTMDGRGAGGGFGPEPAPPPPQPCSQANAVRSRRNCKAARIVHAHFSRRSSLFSFVAFCVRGRMHGGMQAKGQRKDETSFIWEEPDIFPDCLS